MRSEFGRGPVELVIPGRRIIVVLDADDAAMVLAQVPTPFHPANWENRKALQWFQPHGALVSTGDIRQDRRAVNEAALDTDSPLHQLADQFVHTIADEAQSLITEATTRQRLDSNDFTTSWWRLVRRVVLGEAAADDHTITDQLWKLRSAGNWSFLALPHRRLRDKFTQRLYRYGETPDRASLLGVLSGVPATGAVDPVGQVPHWLFAFDAAGMALLRALAVLTTHPEHHERALQETGDLDVPQMRAYLRACVLESVRLWPTTPTILRETTEDTDWREGSNQFTIGGGAALMIVTPAFHRDDQLLPFAHQFTPDIWLDGRGQHYPERLPFSASPAECPGRNLVLFTTSTFMANLLAAVRLELQSRPQPSPTADLPMTLNQFGLEFAVQPRARAAAS
jgi:Cytochrome P450